MKTAARRESRAPLLAFLPLLAVPADGWGITSTAVETGIGTSNAADAIYRLSEEASFAEGCFDGCLCPVRVASSLVGTFVLEPAAQNAEVLVRAVREVNWTAAFGETTFPIVGSGLYRLEGEGDDARHSLELELSIDGDEGQHFSSGFVPMSRGDGAIEISVSMGGMACYDIVVDIRAAVVPPADTLPYELTERSTYQQGCFDPCDCVLEDRRPLSGRFTLVPLLVHGTFSEFAVSGARFRVPPSPLGEEIHFSGFGAYTLIQGFAGPAHGLELRLTENGGEPELYDHDENTEPTFPRAIDIAVDQNDRVCFDRVLRLDARLAKESLWGDGFESGDTGTWSATVEENEPRPTAARTGPTTR